MSHRQATCKRSVTPSATSSRSPTCAWSKAWAGSGTRSEKKSCLSYGKITTSRCCREKREVTAIYRAHDDVPVSLEGGMWRSLVGPVQVKR